MRRESVDGKSIRNFTAVTRAGLDLELRTKVMGGGHRERHQRAKIIVVTNPSKGDRRLGSRAPAFRCCVTAGPRQLAESPRVLVAALRNLLEAAGPKASPFLHDWPCELTGRQDTPPVPSGRRRASRPLARLARERWSRRSRRWPANQQRHRFWRALPRKVWL
jgi:hypothetical protein